MGSSLLKKLRTAHRISWDAARFERDAARLNQPVLVCVKRKDGSINYDERTPRPTLMYLDFLWANVWFDIGAPLVCKLVNHRKSKAGLYTVCERCGAKWSKDGIIFGDNAHHHLDL